MLIRSKAVHFDFYKRRINELVEQFPSVFDKAFPYPLAIGIHEELAKRTEFSSVEIAALLRIWTHRCEYYCMAQSVGSRVDLDGNLTLMTPEHVAYFASVHPRISDEAIKHFAHIFRKKFGRPAFIAVPIKLRKEIELGTTQEKGSCDGHADETECGGSGTCCGNCKG